MRERRPIVFLGPSLPLVTARQVLDADYRAPLQSGDLDGLPHPTTVGIIDGVIEPNGRLGIDEIRRALDRGSRVLGAASTGALLASRIRHRSMQGIGSTYEYLVRHPENAEDLVAVLYAEHNLAPLTEPLINAVLTCIATCYRSAEPQPDLSAIVSELRSIPLSDRSHETVLKRLRCTLTDCGARIVPRRIRDYKAADARLLLRRLSQFGRKVPPDAGVLYLDDSPR